jgi:uncharacterized protein YkwD
MNRAKAAALLSVAVAVTFGSGAVSARADGDQGAAVLTQINAARAANGCPPVAANPQLTASAARQANDMLMHGVQGHTGSDGSSLAQRVTAAGYTPYANLGEVVFWGTGAASNPAAAVNWWMNSPGHRAIITNCTLTDAGFSAVSNGVKMAVAGDFGQK